MRTVLKTIEETGLDKRENKFNWLLFCFWSFKGDVYTCMLRVRPFLTFFPFLWIKQHATSSIQHPTTNINTRYIKAKVARMNQVHAHVLYVVVLLCVTCMIDFNDIFVRNSLERKILPVKGDVFFVVNHVLIAERSYVWPSAWEHTHNTYTETTNTSHQHQHRHANIQCWWSTSIS